MNTLDNSADLISRGASPKDLLSSKPWWSGPSWLSQTPAHWPRRPDLNRDTSLPELKPAVLIVQPPPEEFGQHCSSFYRLCHVTAWIIRFYNRTRNRKSAPTPHLTCDELDTALQCLILVNQRYSYASVITSLQKCEQLSIKHPLAYLLPYLDDSGCLRVGGGGSCKTRLFHLRRLMRCYYRLHLV